MKSTLVSWMCGCATLAASAGPVNITGLRCEYLVNPLGIETPAPRLSWQIESTQRGQKQTAYRLLVASSEKQLSRQQGNLWDSGKIASDQTVNLGYAGKPLVSRQACFWKVQVWDRDGQASDWSSPATWTMGLLQSNDWTAQWISFRDTTPLATNRSSLWLPPARHYRKDFRAAKSIRRATLHASALGLVELHLNGQRVGEAYFEPGWSDYLKRAYYRSHDVTALLHRGPNCVGAIVADGWYAGYVGYGLLVGYGPNKTGRYFYGKTPALLAQLEIEYTDGSRQIVATDNTWKVTGHGPLREADLIMGESYDARQEMPGWDKPGFKATGWEPAIRAEENGSTKAVFSDTMGNRDVELGFQKPERLQAYTGPPIRITEELPAKRLSEPKPGVYIFDLDENFAGFIRLRVHGSAGTKLQIRYGEMLHPDGRLMTENLRKARATDYYILRGDPNGETWTPRFTYHGFQFVEIAGLAAKPGLDTVTGLVLHSDTPLSSSFACSDEVMNQLFRNIRRTQRANFVELPTDCPQRDERLGWMGDAQIYVRAASYNADVASFFTKWMDDVEEAQRSFGAYPDYCPYPMSHGEPRKSFGTAWTDAGIICPWTIFRVYGDTRIIERHYDSFTRFMDFRTAANSNNLGVSIGNPWGDWLNLNEATPVEYIDTCYFASSSRMMAEMSEAIGRQTDAANYRRLFADIKSAFIKKYVKPDGSLTVDTQTAYVLALTFELLPDKFIQPAADRLADKIEKNGCRMATGFLGTKPLLPVLSAHGHHDLAVRLFQSRQFPSWGYEVVNGATSIWERWDSYTKEDAFGKHNAAMNSFSHYSFGAVCEWMFRDLAGIDTEGVGFKKILFRPGPPAPNSNPDHQPIDWVKTEYDSIHGPIRSAWKRDADRFEFNATVPANTTATVFLPASSVASITENGQPLAQVKGATFLRLERGRAVLAVESGSFRFVSTP